MLCYCQNGRSWVERWDYLLRGGGNENADPESLSTVLGTAPETPKPSSRSLKVQIIENDSRIAELEARVSVLEAEVLSLTNTSLKSSKRKAETALSGELMKRHKRIKRLENERSTWQKDTAALISELEEDLITFPTRVAPPPPPHPGVKRDRQCDVIGLPTKYSPRYLCATPRLPTHRAPMSSAEYGFWATFAAIGGPSCSPLLPFGLPFGIARPGRRMHGIPSTLAEGYLRRSANYPLSIDSY
ncbi:hypothetical protein B0H14DRAFT_3564943 [Mycena olivaceomarginata]|nr:hypothetical protein B0H14DRAFT_3564943 [Mycena olivaceomarginata]